MHSEPPCPPARQDLGGTGAGSRSKGLFNKLVKLKNTKCSLVIYSHYFQQKLKKKKSCPKKIHLAPLEEASEQGGAHTEAGY